MFPTRHVDPAGFVGATRSAPCVTKRDFIVARVSGRDVLDLGCVGHSLDACRTSPGTWLHNAIRESARSVLGVDRLGEEVDALKQMGYDVVAADALSLRLDRTFDVVVCADLIEHVTDPGALLETIGRHLRDDGIALVTTPNPFAANRFFNILLDGTTPINPEHVSWFCPQTLFQLAERSGLFVADFRWLETGFPVWTRRRWLGRLANLLSPGMARRNGLFHTDFGVVLRRKPAAVPSAGPGKPFVSVILPTRDRSAYLDGAFRSLLAQDYPADRYEIIVVDNASTDGTPQLVRRLSAEASPMTVVKYVREERHGLVFARHTGAAHAEGDILLFGDDDAVFDGNWISAMVEIHLRYPDAGAAGSRIAIRWDREPEPWVRRHEEFLGKLDYGDDPVVRPGLNINGGSFSIRKALLLEFGGFNPGQKGDSLLGDSETGLCRKLAAAGIPVAWTPATTVWHLQRADVHGTSGDVQRRYRNAGISDAYHATFQLNWNFRQILADIYWRANRLARLILGGIRHRDRERLQVDIPFHAARLAHYVLYLWRYRAGGSLRKEVLAREWEFTAAYKAPPLGFRKDPRGAETYGGESVR